MPDWLIYIVVAVVLQFAAAALTPRAKPQAPTALSPPTASAGNPIPVVRGTRTITGTNTLWYGDVQVRQRTPS